MGFGSVYRSLTEIFPQIDPRILRAVAIEHPKDADEAAAVVLSEIVPSLPSNLSYNFAQSWNKSSGNFSEREVERGLEDVVSRCRSLLVDSGSNSSASSSSKTTFLVVSQDHDTSAPSTDLVPNMNELTNLPPNVGRDVCHKDLESEEIQSLKTAHGKEHDFFGKCFDVSSEAKLGLHVPKDDVASEVSAVAPITDLVPNMNELTNLPPNVGRDVCHKDLESEEVQSLKKARGKEHDLFGKCSDVSSKAKLGLHVPKDDVASEVSAVAQENVKLISDFWEDLGFHMNWNEAEIAVSKLVDLTPGDNTRTIQQASYSEVGSGSTNVVDETSTRSLACENGDTVGEAFSTSTHVFSVDHLEEIIEDAKTNKKTLLTVMESVMNLMREVELQEKNAEKSKEEAIMGGLYTLQKVEELKKTLEHAKGANDMHAGEVYGEKSILATEVKELENRLLNLSEERNKSLAVLDEMRGSLEIRLAAALEMKKTAEEEKKEKEDSALKALCEQEANMEKIVQESKLLQELAEKNSKLREFLMDRGQIVDSLQGEISVICQDVKLLKEKFDNRVSLTKSISSSHTSSCGSSVRSLVFENPSERWNGVPETSSNNKIPEAAASSMDKEKDYWRDLLEDGWDIFDKETEL